MNRVLSSTLCACLALLLPACSHLQLRGSQKEEKYITSSAGITAGMTRAEVYAVLPPVGTPQALPPRLVWFLGAGYYSYHYELHNLPDGRSVAVIYRLEDIDEYPQSDVHPDNVERMFQQTVQPLIAGKPRENQADRSFTMDEVDEMYASKTDWVASAENRADVVHLVSEIRETPTNEEIQAEIRDSIFTVPQGTSLDILLNPPPVRDVDLGVKVLGLDR